MTPELQKSRLTSITAKVRLFAAGNRGQYAMSMQEWFYPPYTPKKVTAVAGAIIGVTTAVAAIANSASVAEPYWLATRGYMRDHVQTSLQKQEKAINDTKFVLADAATRQIGMEIKLEDSEKNRIKSKIFELELELKKNPDTPENIRRIISDQINELKEELDNKAIIINDLRRLQRRAP